MYYVKPKNTLKMKARERNELTLDQLISTLEVIDDQLQDQRLKLRNECESERPYEWLKYRVSVVQHYRNTKINLLSRVDRDKISRREIIGLMHSN